MRRQRLSLLTIGSPSTSLRFQNCPDRTIRRKIAFSHAHQPKSHHGIVGVKMRVPIRRSSSGRWRISGDVGQLFQSAGGARSCRIFPLKCRHYRQGLRTSSLAIGTSQRRRLQREQPSTCGVAGIFSAYISPWPRRAMDSPRLCLV